MANTNYTSGDGKEPSVKAQRELRRQLQSLEDSGVLEPGDTSTGMSLFISGIMSKADILKELKDAVSLDSRLSANEYKMGTDLTGSKSIREAAKAKGKKLPKKLKVDKMGGGKVHGAKKKKGMMGGGKVYASMNKKYGGGIYPKKGNM